MGVSVMRNANEIQKWIVTFSSDATSGSTFLFMKVVDGIQEFLSSGHALEAVDVNDRDSVTHLIEPVLDVGRSTRI